MLAGLIAVLLVIKVPGWLVVEGEAQKADVAVILGGGGGSRSRAGVSLYDAGLASQLLLIDKSKQDWVHVVENLCHDCTTQDKDMVYLEGSSNTFTDATLVSQYIASQGIDRMIVVTDPYHTRRALLIFKAQFKDSSVDISVVSSGDYAKNLRPDEKWWHDDQTARVILQESTKIVGFYLREWF